MFGVGIQELLVILVIVLLLFGTKKLKTLGADLGSAIKGFRTAIGGDAEATTPPRDPVDGARVIEGEATPGRSRTDGNV